MSKATLKAVNLIGSNGKANGVQFIMTGLDVIDTSELSKAGLVGVYLGSAKASFYDAKSVSDFQVFLKKWVAEEKMEVVK